MSDYTAKKVKDMEAAFGGGFVKARAELGVTSFGMQVIQMPPNYEDYPLHDHAESGQEEVFLALHGSGWIDIEGERVDLEPDMLVRVGPEPKRKVFAGPEGLRMLALGGTPGAPYEVVQFTELTVESPRFRRLRAPATRKPCRTRRADGLCGPLARRGRGLAQHERARGGSQTRAIHLRSLYTVLYVSYTYTGIPNRRSASRDREVARERRPHVGRSCARGIG